jgi:hypothetical protein
MAGKPHRLTILKNMDHHNLGQLMASLVHPDRELTDVDRALADEVMNEVTG